MSEPSNGAWPFQEIPEEEGLDISAIFGDSSAAPQGDPFAPPAAAQSVPSSPTPVAQEITPAVAATSQPTTAPIAKAPVEAPAENPIAAAFEQKTAENTKKGLLEKPPVFYHKGVKEEIDDPSMTFEELRIRKSDDFTDLEEGKRVSWSVEYCGIRKEVKDPKGTTIISMKEMIERSREFLDALKKTKDKDPCCYVKPKVEMKTKGNAAYKGKFGTLEEARNSDIRGFNMSVQVAVQSLSQWKEKYPGTEWENQLGSFDMTLYMGCNDMTSAEYFAKKCGKVTISVTNNQFPLAPLFSPVYSTTRPYSQTRSNTQRDLLQPDEFLRLDKFKCIVMFNHYKPAELYKIMLEELPAYKELVKCSVFDYVPEWKRREDENKQRTSQKTASVPHESSAGHSSQAAAHFVQPENTSEKKQVPDREKACTRKSHAVTMPRQKSGEQCIYDFSDMKEGTSPEDIGLVEMTRSAVIGEDDSDLEELDDPSRIPPGRGI